MAIYKVLSIGETIVITGDERWESLEAALNELADANRELANVLSVSVPQAEKFASEKWHATVIMANRVMSPSQEIERQIEKLKKQIATEEKKLAGIPEDKKIARVSINQTLRELADRIEHLQQKRKNMS